MKPLQPDGQADEKERTVKEYPRNSYWLAGKIPVTGGTLVLTSARLIFLRRSALDKSQKDEIIQHYKTEGFTEAMDYALKLDKLNFQIPLSNIIGAKIGLFRYLPMPRFRLIVGYYTGKKKRFQETGFWFRVPTFQFDFLLIREWSTALNRAVKTANQPVKWSGKGQPEKPGRNNRKNVNR